MTITPLARLATAALALIVAATPLRAEDAHYLVKKAIGPTNPELRDMILAVYTAEESGDLLRLQIGFRNMGDKAAEAYGLLSESDFRLSADGQARSIQPKAFAANLTAIVPPGGLKPGSANAGTVTFSKPAGSKLELLVAGFGPIGFELDKAAAFKPIVAAGKARTILVNTEMRSAHEQLALIPLAVRQIEIAPGAIHFDVAFLNRTRNTISAQSPVTGRDAKFVDGFGNVVSPSEVTTVKLVKASCPQTSRGVRADYPGRITFPLPHPRRARHQFTSPPTAGSAAVGSCGGAYKIETSEQEGAAELDEAAGQRRCRLRQDPGIPRPAGAPPRRRPARRLPRQIRHRPARDVAFPRHDGVGARRRYPVRGRARSGDRPDDRRRGAQRRSHHDLSHQRSAGGQPVPRQPAPTSCPRMGGGRRSPASRSRASPRFGRSATPACGRRTTS
ncbi:MAG: hypothetical protein R3F11_17545 [Verrucomicrobiales bacterium]